MNGFGGGESWARSGNGDGGRVDEGGFESRLEIEFVGGDDPNRILLVAGDAIIVIIGVVAVDIGDVGHNGLSSKMRRMVRVTGVGRPRV
jgi:hypothetical protein